MPVPKPEEAREERIAMEIIVDCYNEGEARSGRYCHLEGKLAFPFQAKCIRERRSSPLKVDESITVTGMFDDDDVMDSLAETQVQIEWQGRTLAVPLAQIAGVGVDAETAEAIADWHYWVAQGRSF